MSPPGVIAGRESADDPFVWPPRREPPHRRDEATDPDGHWLDERWPREPGRVAGAIAELERVLLGGGSESLAWRAHAMGWRPEPAGRACWRCAGSVGEHEVDADGCSACRASRPPWARAIRLGLYESPLREAVHDLKFKARRPVGRELGRLLGLRLAHDLDRTGLLEAGGIIVPIPISTRRRLARGVDHTLVLAKAASVASGLDVVRLLRRVHRPSQLSVPPSQREANVRGSIRARRGVSAPETGVVVVLDDVRTTGATMRAACRAVASMGVDRGRIWACVAGVREARTRREPAAERQSGSGGAGEAQEPHGGGAGAGCG